MSYLKTKSKIPTLKTVVSTIGSIATAVMVIRSVTQDYLPPEFKDYLHVGFRKFVNKFTTNLTVVIYESNDLQDNPLYRAAELYISSRVSSETHHLKATTSSNKKNVDVTMEVNEEFTDIYNGVKLFWCSVSKTSSNRQYYDDEGNLRYSRNDLRSFELTFHQNYKDMVLNDYLPFIIKHAEVLKQDRKVVKLFINDRTNLYSPSMWTSVNLDHPSNFATLAMDTDIKEKVMKDLDRFLERREYYRKVGRAWKRGYLMYGPPGTGKSSLIAAMANYLNFDIYDLELTGVSSNSELRSLLMGTANRSILVVEDIDCSVVLHDRAVTAVSVPRPGHQEDNKVTLSGFLNFIDGLWSSCGDERIIIFTTNRKDKLDPALVRPGRMDVHINMSYCTPCGFRLLASTYLDITQHHLFEEIENLIREVEVTPAEVAEQLLKDDDRDIALGCLIEILVVKKKRMVEAKDKAKKDQELVAKNMKQQEESSKCVPLLNG